jgi:hypothetical protein
VARDFAGRAGVTFPQYLGRQLPVRCRGDDHLASGTDVSGDKAHELGVAAVPVEHEDSAEPARYE